MKRKINKNEKIPSLSRWRWILLFFILPSLFSPFGGAGGGGMGCHAQDVDYKAYTLFLYNFMKYVEWPDLAGDFVIGVVGDSPIQKELTTLSENKKAKGRKIVVKIILTPEDALACNMIYIPSSKSTMLKPIAVKVKDKSVLIVGEREGLAKKGAGISFLIDEDDVLRFDINKSVLNGHNLKVANVLIQLGTLVG